MDEQRLLLRRVVRRNFGIGEVEEGQRPAVADAVEGVAVGEPAAGELGELRLLDPGRDQRQAEDVLVELPCPFLVGADIGVVMQPRRQGRSRVSHDGFLLLLGL